MKYPQLVSMPSAVSDWLDEQLEARGIDAVVYTRYVLSLLYRDPIDVICPDQDIHFTQPDKEVRRSGGSRKRLRRSSGWWGHDLADADKLKRSAAVECLMSASDQKCGIESLVDELCEKLKEINSNNQNVNGSELLPEKKRVLSPQQDPAKRYYAAFPPLRRNSSVNSPNLINLIPKWFGSPKKRMPRKQNRPSSYEEKLHCKVELDNMKARTTSKQRYNYFNRNKKDYGYCRNVGKSIEKSDNVNNWDHLYLFNNTVKNKSSQVKDNFSNDKSENSEALNSWAADDNLNMYDDLPVDIRELLDSPSPQEDDTVEMMNLANMRDAGKKTFIPYGTHINGSIWSTEAAMDDENAFNENCESLLDMKFSSISIDGKTSWSEVGQEVFNVIQNETNSYFENFNFTPWATNSSGEKFQKWSEAENDLQTNDVMRSLSILNHSKDSSFTEVIPRPAKGNIFGNSNTAKSTNETALKKLDFEEEDLLHSVHSHFKPIADKLEVRNGQFEDGTTFLISGKYDNIDYKRSDSGFFYLDTEQNSRKYLDFRRTVGSEFSLKFNVAQNDKASQTDDELSEIDAINDNTEQESFYFPGDEELFMDNLEKSENPESFVEDADLEAFEESNSDDNLLREICDNNKDTIIIGGINKAVGGQTTSWNSVWFDPKSYDGLDEQTIRDIWKGEVVPAKNIWKGEVVTTDNCIHSFHKMQLLEDCNRAGDELLSDVDIVRKTFQEQELLPAAEVSCNINELIEMRERKRRHSSINFDTAMSLQDDATWSFAAHLQEACLLKIGNIPTLRSVTL